MILDKIVIAGFGGQGVLRIGQMIAYAGLEEGLEISWLPSYGTEMRGGTSNCNVIVSDQPIASPLVRKATFAIVMNLPSLLKFESWVVPGGKIVINSSLVDKKVERNDIDAYYIPSNEIAEELGNPLGMNMPFLGAYAALTNTLPLESLNRIIDKSFTGSKEKFATINKELVKEGYDLTTQTANASSVQAVRS